MSERVPTALVCPRCARSHPPEERFCERCGVPLVQADRAPESEAPASERRRRARKIKPQYTEGELVRVARAQNLMQAEFMAGLLLEEGIPSMLRAPIAGYAPVIGTREILVPASAAEAARDALRWPSR